MKEMLVSWDILRNANFSPIFFLQGDFGIGNLKIVLRSLNKDFQGNIRLHSVILIPQQSLI